MKQNIFSSNYKPVSLFTVFQELNDKFSKDKDYFYIRNPEGIFLMMEKNLNNFCDDLGIDKNIIHIDKTCFSELLLINVFSNTHNDIMVDHRKKSITQIYRYFRLIILNCCQQLFLYTYDFLSNRTSKSVALNRLDAVSRQCAEIDSAIIVLTQLHKINGALQNFLAIAADIVHKIAKLQGARAVLYQNALHFHTELNFLRKFII